MSTATQTQPVFGELAAQDKPQLACIGYVESIAPPKETKGDNEFSIKYHMYTVQIAGFGAGRKARVNLMIRPEWLTTSFKTSSFGEVDGGSGMEFLYGKNVSQKGNVSVLQGLIGVDKPEDPRWNEFCLALASANGDPTGIYEVLQDFIIEQGHGALIGYVLKQQREKAGLDENGKQEYINTQYYEVGTFFNPNEKGRQAQYRRAQTAKAGSFKVQFTEDDVPC